MTKKSKVVLGVVMMLTPLVCLYIACGYSIGFLKATLMFGCIFGGWTCFGIGCYWLID